MRDGEACGDETCIRVVGCGDGYGDGVNSRAVSTPDRSSISGPVDRSGAKAV
ncbi:hypothetical protein Acr_00g0066050 [Actinidia rufa]|uniref:Uncharacterized protein n=1 Tax=Actinidia rufa TaxID=165716 RepID=A0A7J0DRT3_9ERIC|nr:hypothetical protein Acr_00g0066050 [Actinidia rufa]